MWQNSAFPSPIFPKQPISGCFFSFLKKLTSDFERIQKNSNEIDMERALSIVYIWSIAAGSHQLKLGKEMQI
ncbi:hypothetical protein ASD40_21685 [Paenibacillus sp. Root444D2]|nr:hypothetical protein ASD40_21685 [Paenibacillus sp. Root444D2]KRE32924.1 hypothetical protein ASG85_15560 [Paenibacillus sp. Soil724D2]